MYFKPPRPKNFVEQASMFSLRIQDFVEQAGSSGSATTSRNPNPRIQAIRGIVHLYRSATSASSSSSSSCAPSLLPAGRGTLLFILAVPNQLSPEDFLRFCGADIDRASEIRLIRNDGKKDRYSVLVKFDDQKIADGFYLNQNGRRFYFAEGVVCHILFVASVEYTDSIEIAGTRPVGSTELPTCPVCLERLDQDISGIVATTCDHSFQCACISKWVNSSCTVCQICREHSEKPTCSFCGTLESLWICVICGFVGCGRYKNGHALKHWKNTQHCYTLDLETLRVWDYVGQDYVHRFNQSRSDDKLVKLISNCRRIGDNCKNCECSDGTGVSGVIYNSKLEATLDEHNHLLANQLENQRQYYETLIQEEKENWEKNISEKVEEIVNLKLRDIQLKFENANKENKAVAEINDNLMRNQNLWREKIREIEERYRRTQPQSLCPHIFNMARQGDIHLKIAPQPKSNRGALWDDGIHRRVDRIFIWYDEGGIRSIRFSYVGQDGVKVLSPMHGGDGNMFQTIEANYPITMISGYYDINGFITSLKFSSRGNTTYGPFGVEKGTSFIYKDENGFTGFHGRSDGNNLYSIGVYLNSSARRQLSSSPDSTVTYSKGQETQDGSLDRFDGFPIPKRVLE